MIDTNQTTLKDLKTIYQILLLSKNLELLKQLQELFYYIYILDIYHEKEKNKSKTTPNQTVRYIYDDDKVIQELSQTSQENITYIYNSYKDDPVAFIKNNQTYYYIKDRQYSIKYITDKEGEIKESYSYTSYGITTIKDSFGNIIQTPMQVYGFTGRRYDAKIKLYHYRNRAYSPTLARFIQTDPKGYVDGYNLYAYVKNNPLRYLDPMGTTKKYGNSLSFSNITDIDISSIDYSSTNYNNIIVDNKTTMTQMEFELSEQRKKELENITISDIGHATLDTIGLVPFFGEPADAINAAWYLKEGDYTNAAFSGAAALPILGWEATGAKYGYKAVKSIDEADSVVKWSEKVDSNIFINSNRVRHSQKTISYRKSRGDMEYTYDDIKYSM